MKSHRSISEYLIETYANDPARRRPLARLTRDQYCQSVAHFNMWISKRKGRPGRLADMTSENLIAYRGDRSLEVSPATCNRDSRALLAIARHAAKSGMIYPVEPIRPLHVPRRIPRAWLPLEVAAILTAAGALAGRVGTSAESTFWRALLLLVLSTGYRIRAVLALRIADYDRPARSIVCPWAADKGRNERAQFLTAEAADALDRLAPWDRFPPGAGLFDDLVGGRSISHRLRLAWHGLRKIIIAAGLEHELARGGSTGAFHRLRRTFGSVVAAASGSVEIARELLGHTAATVTAAYLDPRIVPQPRASDYLPTWDTRPLDDPPAFRIVG